MCIEYMQMLGVNETLHVLTGFLDANSVLLGS